MVGKRFARREDLGLSSAEFGLLRRLDTPRRIQDFVYGLKQNFELGGETCLTVREVLRTRRAHCIEGAMLAACAFWVNGEPPLLLDMRAVHDFDHVVALYPAPRLLGRDFQDQRDFLRSRDPVYRDLRELAMSYFHEYANRRNRQDAARVLGALRPAAAWIRASGSAEKRAPGRWPAALDDIRHFRLVAGRPP
jgi:hypothetical protein